MSEDIRDKALITHEDVVGLNFIKSSGPFVFRRHFRQGLRSHIMEVLTKKDVHREKAGTPIDGLMWYPRARPVRMFRIFRTRLETLDSALREVRRVKLVERYLAPEFLARSNEFIVDYMGPHGRELMLCGFQEYVDGEIIDPWGILRKEGYIPLIYESLQERIAPGIKKSRWVNQLQQKADIFIQRVKMMISQSAHVPDLAGVGNLVVAHTGDIKLVDINNISKVVFDSEVRLDDRGYPVCDKSIEALYLLEGSICGKSPDASELIYRTFLEPSRKKIVRACEEQFYRKKKTGHGYPPPQR